MKEIRNLAHSHVSENSFSVKPQPVPKEIKEKMEHAADEASKMIDYYNMIYSQSNIDSDIHAVKKKV